VTALPGVAGGAEDPRPRTQDLYSAQLTTRRPVRRDREVKQEPKKLSPLSRTTRAGSREEGVRRQVNILRARLSSMQMTGSLSSVISNVRQLEGPAATAGVAQHANQRLARRDHGAGRRIAIIFPDRLPRPLDQDDLGRDPGGPVHRSSASSRSSPAPTSTARTTTARATCTCTRTPSSSIAECCRSLRTNILFSAADRDLKSIVVCQRQPARRQDHQRHLPRHDDGAEWPAHAAHRYRHAPAPAPQSTNVPVSPGSVQPPDGRRITTS